jgi:hypothetical protein
MNDYKHDNFIKAISNSINREKLILFLGAGFSKLCGLPLWSDLAEKLLKVVVKEKSVCFDETDKAKLQSCIQDPRELISIAYNYMSTSPELKRKFFDSMKECLTIDADHENPKSKKNRLQLRKFVKKTHATVITTNADTILDNLFDKDCVVIGKKRIETFAPNLEKPQIVHLHGSVTDYTSLIFTTDQYLTFYNSDLIKNMIRAIFRQDSESTILFIGYGFTELQLLDFMITPCDSQPIQQNRFALNGYYSYQKNVFEAEKQYYKVYGLQLISYPRDKLGYAGLLPALNYIYRKCEPLTNLQTKALLAGDKAISSEKNVTSEKMLNDTLLRVDYQKKLWLVEKAALSPYSNLWIPYFMNSKLTRHFFSFRNPTIGNKDKDPNKFVGYPAIQIIKNAFSYSKSDLMYRLSTKTLHRAFDWLERYPDLFTKYALILQIQNWIFSDARLADLPECIAFVEKSSNQTNGLEDWLTWCTYQTNVLFSISKESALAYSRLAIKSGAREGFDCYGYGSFIEKYSKEYAKRYPNEIAQMCINHFKDEINDRFYGYDYSKDPFWKIKESIERSTDKFEDLTSRWLIYSIDAMSDGDIRALLSIIPESSDFFINLRIYVYNSHYPFLKNEFWKSGFRFLNNRRAFSEFYGLIENQVKTFSPAEHNHLISLIREMKITKRSDFFTKACQIDLLNLLIPTESEGVIPGTNASTQLKNDIISTMPADEINSLPDFLSPINISKNMFVEENDGSKDDEKKKAEILALDNEEYLKLLSTSAEDQYDKFVAEEAFTSFIEKKQLLSWLTSDQYKNFSMFPSSEYVLLFNYVFSNECTFTLTQSLELAKKCLENEKDENRHSNVFWLLRNLYFTLNGKFQQSQADSDEVFSFTKKLFQSETFDWSNKQNNQLNSYQFLLQSEPFYPLGIMALTFSEKETKELERLFDSLFEDEIKSSLSKATIAAHIGQFWKADPLWTASKLPTIFSNKKDGRNVSYLGFSIAQFFDKGFIDALLDCHILEPLLNSKEFDESGYLFGNDIFWWYLDGTCREEAAIVVETSMYGISSFHMFLENLLKKTDYIKDHSNQILSLLDVVAEKGLGGSRHTDGVIAQLIALHSMVSYKGKVINAICKLAGKWTSVCSKDIQKAITESDFSNVEKIKAIKALIMNVDDAYLFLDDLIELIHSADWSNNELDFNLIRNQLAKLNPTIIEKI